MEKRIWYRNRYGNFRIEVDNQTYYFTEGHISKDTIGYYVVINDRHYYMQEIERKSFRTCYDNNDFLYNQM